MKWLAVLILFVASTLASEQSGQVLFSGLPVPGVTVTATQGKTKLVNVTDLQGFYHFADLPAGVWTLTTEMTGFSPMTREVTVAPNAPAEKCEMKLLPLEQITAAIPM